MRRPLKFQVMLPMSCVMLVSIVLVSLVDAWIAGHRAQQRIEGQLRDIRTTLSQATFPLTDGVLQQLRGLCGAEFVVADSDGSVLAASAPIAIGDAVSAASTLVAPPQTIALNHRVLRNDATYFHVVMDLSRPSFAGRTMVLHCFYPESEYKQVWRQAVWPPVAVGALALLLVVVVSSVTALRVTRPIDRLRDHMQRIAKGEFVSLAVPRRNDELRDLSIAVNRMAEMLAQYEASIRSHERLRTLDRLGGGIAHQLRNSVTGCRMAVDLHKRRCPLELDESMAVAVQQLALMEEYLRRFLSLGKHSNQPFAAVDLTQVVDNVLPLVRPRMDHLGIVLEWQRPDEPLMVNGDADGLSQVVVNLVINAVDAAAQSPSPDEAVSGWRRVAVSVVRTADGRVRLEVSDSGSGPGQRVEDTLFEPMVSGKPDGVGLGLAIVRETVEHHRGTIQWRRQDNLTCFSVELPVMETRDVDAACCR